MSRLWLEYGDRGAGVKRWQEMLLRAGYKLPKWGADGGWGDETQAATLQAQRDLTQLAYYEGAIDAKVGDLTLAAMRAHLDANAPAHKADAHLSIVEGVEIHDYRGHFRQPSNAKPGFGDRWPKLRGVVLHRTACRMGERPGRYEDMNAHIAVTLKGRIILCHPWDLHIWHGHRPSLWAIGIELDGNPEGFPGYHWKPGGGPDPVTDAQVKACGVLLNLIRHEFAAHDRELEYIYAHRQSSDQRECDPGWEAWQKVAMPWLAATGATSGDNNGVGGTTFGSGFCIPKQWDPASPFDFREQGEK